MQREKIGIMELIIYICLNSDNSFVKWQGRVFFNRRINRANATGKQNH